MERYQKSREYERIVKVENKDSFRHFLHEGFIGVFFGLLFFILILNKSSYEDLLYVSSVLLVVGLLYYTAYIIEYHKNKRVTWKVVK